MGTIRPDILDIVDRTIAQFEIDYPDRKLDRDTLSVIFHEERYPIWICEYTLQDDTRRIVIAHFGGFLFCSIEQFEQIKKYKARGAY